MNARQHGSHDHAAPLHHQQDQKTAPSHEAVDPVCGMRVDRSSALTHRVGEEAYYFCSAGCREKFAANPGQHLKPAPTQLTQEPAVAGTVWTCPMHPEIRRDGPGACPICGMALEPLAPSAEEGENAEL